MADDDVQLVPIEHNPFAVVGKTAILQMDPNAQGMLQGGVRLVPVEHNPFANENVPGGPSSSLDMMLSKLPPPPSEDTRLYNQAVLQQQWDRVLKQPITEEDRQAAREFLTGPDSPLKQ